MEEFITAPLEADGLLLRPLVSGDNGFEEQPSGTLLAQQGEHRFFCSVLKTECLDEMRLMLSLADSPLAGKAALALVHYALYVKKEDALFFFVPDGDSQRTMVAAMIGGLPYARMVQDGKEGMLFRMEDSSRDVDDNMF